MARRALDRSTGRFDEVWRWKVSFGDGKNYHGGPNLHEILGFIRKYPNPTFAIVDERRPGSKRFRAAFIDGKRVPVSSWLSSKHFFPYD